MSELTHNQTILLSVDDQTHQPAEDSSQISVVDTLPSSSQNQTILMDGQGCDDLNPTPTSESGPRRKSKKKKNKGKKKKMNFVDEDKAHDKSDIEGEKSELDIQFGSIDLSPFTSSSSAMQNKLKPLYDELRKCHESNKVRLLQIVEFSHGLVDARSDLQRRVDVLMRKFAITKALLLKADRSSFERYKRQISKLDFEKQRLVEDGAVYNHLTEQFKLSQAYKKMLELKASIEEVGESRKFLLGETSDDDFSEISFEELLAQEKKDTFWQKNGISR